MEEPPRLQRVRLRAESHRSFTSSGTEEPFILNIPQSLSPRSEREFAIGPSVSFSIWYFRVRAIFYAFYLSLFRGVEQFCDTSVTPPAFDDVGFLKSHGAGPNSLLAALVHSRVFDHHLAVGLGCFCDVALYRGSQV